MARLDHSKANNRDRIARHGSEDIRDCGLPAGLGRPKARPAKASIRAEAEAAIAAATRTIKCNCGHSAAVPVTAKMRGKNFRCSECGERVAA